MSKSRGFTLLEIMIVLAIVAGVVVMAMPYMSNRNSKTRSFLRQFTILSRELHTRAKLHGTTYRLVIDLKTPDGSGRPPEQTFWVEKSNGRAVLKPDEEEAAVKRAAESRAEDRKDPRGFEKDESLSKDKGFPGGLVVEKVELTRLNRPVTNGKAYIHYLPEGLTDEANIHITGAKNQAWTISIHPLTGKAEVISKAVSLQEMKQ